jgi:YfiH family protein
MWSIDAHSDPPLWRPGHGLPAIVAAFTTRRGGVSAPPFDTLNLGRSTDDRADAVEENRRRTLTALALDPARLATAGQVHGNAVTRADAPGLHPACDALVTTVPGLVLAVTAADCLPVLLVAPGAVAAVHAGWRGAAAGVAEAALAAVCALAGVAPDRVRAHFGPCIRDCCYEVGPEVAAQFPAEAIRRDGRLMLSVPTAVRLRLLAAGVSPEGIEDTGACTACEPHQYFSHRRDRGRTGRQWGLISRSEPSS